MIVSQREAEDMYISIHMYMFICRYIVYVERGICVCIYIYVNVYTYVYIYICKRRLPLEP